MRVLILLFLLVGVCVAQPQRYVLTNGVIHTATEPEFEGFVVVNGEVIEQVGRGAPPALTAIDLEGAHLYPALIDADNALGLVEVESLRATTDNREVGDLNPNLIARYAFRAESDTIGVARSQGVLYSGVNPSGSAVAGQGSVMRLWGWDWRDMTVRPTWALAVDWPGVQVALDAEEEKKKKALEKIGRELFFLDDAFAQAQSYRDTELKDVKWGALKPYAQGEAPVIVRAGGEARIRTALSWAERHNLKMVLVAGRDVQKFADELARRRIPVVYESVFNENPHPWQSYDLHYRVPSMLKQAGVVVALSPGGLAFDVRELRDLAGRVRAFGLNSVEALQSVTLNPARIMGVADHLGSIEKGKKASFVLCQGDLLEVGPMVTRAWGEGREINLDDRQKELYRKYKQHLQVEQTGE